MVETDSSDFNNEKREIPDGPIDFSRATKLESSGSTCDVYLARHHRRAVFVKRLKPKFRDSPSHRAAFEKEFETGGRLEHCSLPTYLDFKGDYILMNYVNGSTLADMIAALDEWLADADNIRRMLIELVDVVDYLHQNGVIHSDIKPDNIMLRHGERHLVLIDLDKAFTDWLDDTAGSAQNYGLSAGDKGNPDIDWRGIGKVIDRMETACMPVGQFSEFRQLCDKPGVTAVALKKELDDKDRQEDRQDDRQDDRHVWLWAAGLMLIVTSGCLIWYALRENSENTSDGANQQVVTQSAALPVDTVLRIIESKMSERKYNESTQSDKVVPENQSISTDVPSMGREETVNSVVAAYLPQMENRLYPMMSNIDALCKSSEYSHELQEALTNLKRAEDYYWNTLKEKVRETIPAITDQEIEDILAANDKVKYYRRQSANVRKKGRAILENRHSD